jgi:hypothetical protein
MILVHATCLCICVTLIALVDSSGSCFMQPAGTLCRLIHAMHYLCSSYAAGAISSICFGQREPLVDGNVVSIAVTPYSKITITYCKLPHYSTCTAAHSSIIMVEVIVTSIVFYCNC